MAQYAYQTCKKYPDFRVLTLLPGPVRTQLFEANKPEVVIDRIEREVGIYNPEQFAKDTIKVLENPDFKNGSFITMYSRQGINPIDISTLNLS
jgi:hypothetical protein